MYVQPSEAESQRRESNAKALPSADSTRHFSVHALVLLGELTATLLDVTYRSEEKERAVPFLINLMAKVFPYLRNHSLVLASSYATAFLNVSIKIISFELNHNNDTADKKMDLIKIAKSKISLKK